jgi:hypothetical protein
VIDTHSSAWRHVEKWANQELSKAQTGNENVKLDAIATAALRGRIKALKDLLAMPTKTAASPVEPNDPYL